MRTSESKDHWQLYGMVTCPLRVTVMPMAASVIPVQQRVLLNMSRVVMLRGGNPNQRLPCQGSDRSLQAADDLLARCYRPTIDSWQTFPMSLFDESNTDVVFGSKAMTSIAFPRLESVRPIRFNLQRRMRCIPLRADSDFVSSTDSGETSGRCAGHRSTGVSDPFAGGGHPFR